MHWKVCCDGKAGVIDRGDQPGAFWGLCDLEIVFMTLKRGTSSVYFQALCCFISLPFKNWNWSFVRQRWDRDQISDFLASVT